MQNRLWGVLWRGKLSLALLCLLACPQPGRPNIDLVDCRNKKIYILDLNDIAGKLFCD